MSKRGFAHVRVGHAGACPQHQQASTCTTGGFYTNPTTGMTVSSSDNFNISWDTSCLAGTSAVDIYLIAPSLTNSRIHEWQNVNFGLGSYQTQLEPKWWNDSSSIQLQLSIVTSGTQPFLSPLPAGPVFTATYTAPTSGSTPASADLSTPNTVTYVNNFPTPSSLTSGKIAAGVLIPLLFIGLGVAYYIKMSRIKAKEKSHRFSQAIDTRMSTISSDWKSMSAAGASAAIRNSIAVPGGARTSSAFSFGSIRPISTVAIEGETGAERTSADGDTAVPNMSQLRPGLRTSAFGERVSRVSFAADVRPSIESRRTVASRAFHVGHVPPVPTRQDSDDLSPVQTQGAFSLTPEDITALMRTGNDDTDAGDDYLLPSQAPVEMPLPPTPVHAAPTSPIGMVPMSASVMSPDEMLRAYAERKMASPPGSPVAFPAATLSYNSRGPRSLYSPSRAEPAFPSPTHIKQGSGESVMQTAYSGLR
ncbi:hypothetical protein F5J12DRAFT_905198 [Pisolithus orientalis]|uniref:uncharacterized protein n=1 Tax=Pisolithus orientalis TaxID=936130 RepID=UPI0022254499|nr:uncharacterized protein F5J12DRAFT_905198 [Pisolithus orientalis]KAI6008839.1 hypothetical protein F5J12DRAFT_905198 [Pisolithus orientalis]